MREPQHPPHGFTLIEVLLAMTLGMVVILLAVSLLGRGQDDYQRIGGNVGAEREARAVLSQLQSDIRSSQSHPSQLLGKSTTPWPADELGLLTLQSPDAQSEAGYIGDLCAVHYYLRDLTIEGKTVRCLMRGFRDSATTFPAIQLNQTASLFSPNERDEPVAFGVLAFLARPKSRNDDGSWSAWQESSETPPEALEIRLVIARRERMSRLKSPADWDNGGPGAATLELAPHSIANRNFEIYSTLIRFGNHASP